MANENQLKAADLLSLSLLFVLTIGTVLAGALLAFASDRDLSISPVWLYGALALLLLSAVVAVANLNSLINKVNAGTEQPVRSGEVRALNALALVLLAVGIGMAAYVVANSKRAGTSSALPNTMISDREIVIGTTETGKVTVFKRSDGQIERIEVVPRAQQ